MKVSLNKKFCADVERMSRLWKMNYIRNTNE